MVIYSHSRLTTFESCPLQYRYRYVDGIKRDVQGIEEFLGKCCHRTLEKLYRDLKLTKLNSLGDLITFFNDIWEREWNDKIQIVKKDYTPENYRKLGERCIRDYYRRYAPFDQGVTLSLEERINITLDEDGRYKMVGYIDRLTQAGDGVYEIHDYKTSARLPTQDIVDEDRQLALYQLAIQDRYPDTEEIRLIWHFLLFDKDLVSHRRPQDLDRLRQDTIGLIDRIESTRDFQPNESELCDWCDYPDLCPIQKHRYRVDSLPVNEYLNEEGVVLVNRYAELDAKKREVIKALDEEIAKVREAIILYAQREGLEVIKGIDHKLRVKQKEDIRFPTKEDPERGELDRLIKRSGKWPEVSDLNLASLAKVVQAGGWDPHLLDEISRYQRLQRTYQIYLSRIMDDERLYETRDL